MSSKVISIIIKSYILLCGPLVSSVIKGPFRLHFHTLGHWYCPTVSSIWAKQHSHSIGWPRSNCFVDCSAGSAELRGDTSKYYGLFCFIFTDSFVLPASSNNSNEEASNFLERLPLSQHLTMDDLNVESTVSPSQALELTNSHSLALWWSRWPWFSLKGHQHERQDWGVQWEGEGLWRRSGAYNGITLIWPWLTNC